MGGKLAIINAISLSGGGGRVFANSLVEYINPQKFEVLAGEWINDDFYTLPEHVKVIKTGSLNPLMRLYVEGREMRKLRETSGAKVAVHLGNFVAGGRGMRNILYVHNALPFSRVFFDVLKKRGELHLVPYFLLQRKMIMSAVKKAALVMTPSNAMAGMLKEHLREKDRGKIRVLPFGLDKERLTKPLPPTEKVKNVLEESEGLVRILHVGNFSYYKNFELLIRAVHVLRDITGGENFRVILTASFLPGVRQHLYRADRELQLMDELRVRHLFLSTGPLPYRVLPHLYMNADAFVWTSVAESYGFPLLESAFFSLPAAASDIPVHREMRPDGVFFSPFSPEECARAIYTALKKGKKTESFHINDVKLHLRRLEEMVEECL